MTSKPGRFESALRRWPVARPPLGRRRSAAWRLHRRPSGPTPVARAGASRPALPRSTGFRGGRRLARPPREKTSRATAAGRSTSSAAIAQRSPRRRRGEPPASMRAILYPRCVRVDAMMSRATATPLEPSVELVHGDARPADARRSHPPGLAMLGRGRARIKEPRGKGRGAFWLDTLGVTVLVSAHGLRGPCLSPAGCHCGTASQATTGGSTRSGVCQRTMPCCLSQGT
jgi:hypothetical protein